MADEVDAALNVMEALSEGLILAVRNLAAPQQVQNEDGSWPQPECVDCGDDIIPERLAMGRIRCTHCQGALEHKGRLRR
jgi:RNA polymerase-binding transcription factor DksA